MGQLTWQQAGKTINSGYYYNVLGQTLGYSFYTRVSSKTKIYGNVYDIRYNSFGNAISEKRLTIIKTTDK